MEDTMSLEEFAEFRKDLGRILKPTIQQSISVPEKIDWLAYFQNLHDSGKCYVTEEFLATIIPAYADEDGCPELHGFQATCDAELLSRLEKDRFEWHFDEGMIMDEIRRQGFDPIIHPCHIAWMIQQPRFNFNDDGFFYMKGTDKKIHSILINSGLDEDSDREDAFFEARRARGDKDFCPHIISLGPFATDADGMILGYAFELVTEKNTSAFTFFATRKE